MAQIIDAEVNFEYALGHHVHCLVAQLPNRLRRADHGYVVTNPEEQWATARSVLELVADAPGSLKALHFLVFPESYLPVAHLEDALRLIADRFRPSTVTVFGLEQVRLRTYREMLARFRDDNDLALSLVDQGLESGDLPDMPVNWCCTVIKEATGKLRVFLEAKSHPFRAEEALDQVRDLYHGRHFYFFQSRPSSFNFVVLICLDYLYRNLYHSNIRHIIEHSNRLFFKTRQTLDALFVVQANPKPEHRAYRDVLSGFYGEYLEDLPGVRNTVTVFGNCSNETAIEGYPGDGTTFGGASVVFNQRARLERLAVPEYSTDDFDGAPLCRVRFGTATRLYYFNLPLHHEIDPRSSRVPLKVHGIYRPADGGGWARISADEMIGAPDEAT
jgi:hypothetical protein